MPEEISGLLKSGQETIVRDWTEKVTADRRINSDARLSYVQLIDHVPQIVEELWQALAGDALPGGPSLQKGVEHGRQRWQQGYELKEVVRELTLLRATLMEFLESIAPRSRRRGPNSSRASISGSTASWTRRFTKPSKPISTRRATSQRRRRNPSSQQQQLGNSPYSRCVSSRRGASLETHRL